MPVRLYAKDGGVTTGVRRAQDRTPLQGEDEIPRTLPCLLSRSVDVQSTPLPFHTVPTSANSMACDDTAQTNHVETMVFFPSLMFETTQAKIPPELDSCNEAQHQ